jgi:hypothetical protein
MEHTDTLWAVRTSQETHPVSATEPNRLMLFGETVLKVGAFWPHTVSTGMFRVVLKKTATVSLNTINRSAFVTE